MSKATDALRRIIGLWDSLDAVGEDEPAEPYREQMDAAVNDARKVLEDAYREAAADPDYRRDMDSLTDTPASPLPIATGCTEQMMEAVRKGNGEVVLRYDVGPQPPVVTPPPVVAGPSGFTPEPQDATTGINAVFGKWPVKMSDAEVNEAMDFALGKPTAPTTDGEFGKLLDELEQKVRNLVITPYNPWPDKSNDTDEYRAARNAIEQYVERAVQNAYDRGYSDA